MDGLQRKTLLKWMIWGHHYFRKHPYEYIWIPWIPPQLTHPFGRFGRFSEFHWADFFEQVTALVHRNLFHDDLQCFARSGLFARWKPREVVSIWWHLAARGVSIFFPSVARHFFQKRKSGTPKSDGGVGSYIEFPFHLAIFFRLLPCVFLWVVVFGPAALPKSKRKTPLPHFCRSQLWIIQLPRAPLETKGRISFSCAQKKKQAPKSSLVAQMGVDMNPRPWWLWYIWLGSTLPQPTTLPDGPCFFWTHPQGGSKPTQCLLRNLLIDSR